MALVLAMTADGAVADLCRQTLAPSGHAVVEATDAAAAMRAMATLDVDVIFLDSAGCGDLEDFWDWLQSSRERSLVPVLFLLPPAMRWVKPPARFRPGVDGVVFRLLDGAELHQKLTSLLRAATERDRASRRFLRSRSGTFIADRERYELWADGASARLTPTEFRLFTYLMERPDEVVSVDELLENVWGFLPGTGGPDVVRAHVSNLRRKMRALGDKALLLQTVARRGYRLADNPSRDL